MVGFYTVTGKLKALFAFIAPGLTAIVGGRPRV